MIAACAGETEGHVVAPTDDDDPIDTRVSSVDAAPYELRLVHLAEGGSLRTLRELELNSLMAPWIDGKSNRPVWVLGLTASVERQLREDGLEIRPFAPPPEFGTWSPDMQRAFSSVGERCRANSGAFFPAIDRWNTAAPPGAEALDVTNARYGPYYLPYRATPGVPSFRSRVELWRDGVTGAGYGGRPLPNALFGGWPLDAPRAARYRVGDATVPSPGPVDMVYVDFGWRAAGTFDGRAHAGPRAVMFLGANQHARELATHEVSWRMLQRIVYAYATGESLGEWDRPAGFWREAIDAGLHVVVIPSMNPWGYHEVVRAGGDWETMPGNSAVWRRKNGRGVDINRNFPVGWFQPGNDGNSTWGAPSEVQTAAGRKPGSEKETLAIVAILEGAIGALGLDQAHADRRMPIVALDMHSALGAVLTSPEVSWDVNFDETDAYPCGGASACTNPDQPFLDAVFGRDARPTVVGSTGYASGIPESVDDPPLPYVHGRGNLIQGPSGGTLRVAFGGPMWFVGDRYRTIPGSLVEVTSSVGNTFGFGTCSPTSDATAAIDQLVLDVAPLVARMAESALSPAKPPGAYSGARDTSGARIPMLELADDIENLGVITEAVALRGEWRVDDKSCADGITTRCVFTPEQVPDCNPTSTTDKCSGVWWTSYTPGPWPEFNQPRGLRTGWQFAVRRSDPDSTPPELGRVRAKLVGCDPAPEDPGGCDGLELVRLRSGSHYDLFTLPLTDDHLPPARVVVARELSFLGNATETSRITYVAKVVPRATSLPAEPSLADIQANGVELASLHGSNEDLTGVLVTQTGVQSDRSYIRLHSAWRGGSDWTLRRMTHGAPDYNATADAERPAASWGGGFTVNQYYTYSFDMVRAVMDASGGPATSGSDIWLAWNYTGFIGAPPPIITAKVQPSLCAMTAVGTPSVILDAARFVRSQALVGDPDGRKLVANYQKHGPEIARLLAAHPGLRGDVEQIVRAAVEHLAEPGSEGSRVELLARVARAMALVELHGSESLKADARSAVVGFPALLSRASSRRPSRWSP